VDGRILQNSLLSSLLYLDSDSAAGSTPDAVLRVIADRLGQIWGQQVLAVRL
jgi:hypothetical protein